MTRQTLGDRGLDLLFRSARTRNAWQDRAVPKELIHAIYDLARMGPTSANGCPARFVFLCSSEAKERLRPHLTEGNIQKAMQAPCCAIVAYDTQFYDFLPMLFPARDMRSTFVGNAALIEDTARRNAVLQGTYLVMGARARSGLRTHVGLQPPNLGPGILSRWTLAI
jgi:3-hydroxypropanoate dehydrogenase